MPTRSVLERQRKTKVVCILPSNTGNDITSNERQKKTELGMSVRKTTLPSRQCSTAGVEQCSPCSEFSQRGEAKKSERKVCTGSAEETQERTRRKKWHSGVRYALCKWGGTPTRTYLDKAALPLPFACGGVRVSERSALVSAWQREPVFQFPCPTSHPISARLVSLLPFHLNTFSSQKFHFNLTSSLHTTLTPGNCLPNDPIKL